MLFLSLSIREQRSFVRSVAWFLFCHCDRATVLCFALLCVGWPDIASYKHMKIYTNVCVRARFTIVTEMEKKLCWHNGNLLFMTRFFFFLSVRHFFLQQNCCWPYIHSGCVIVATARTSVLQTSFYIRLFFFTAFFYCFYWSSKLYGFKWMLLFNSIIMNEITHNGTHWNEL